MIAWRCLRFSLFLFRCRHDIGSHNTATTTHQARLAQIAQHTCATSWQTCAAMAHWIVRSKASAGQQAKIQTHAPLHRKSSPTTEIITHYTCPSRCDHGPCRGTLLLLVLCGENQLTILFHKMFCFKVNTKPETIYFSDISFTSNKTGQSNCATVAFLINPSLPS